jgi:multiple sugar transport system permease protein
MPARVGSLQLRSAGRLAITYLTAGLLGLFLSLPLVWIVLTAFKPTPLVLTSPPTWIFPPTLAHFSAIFDNTRFWRYLLNTAVVTAATMAVTLTVGTLAAYGMARHRTGGRPVLYATLAVRALPPIVLGLPMFVLFTRLGLIDTLAGLTVAYTAFMLPNTIWLMLAFFESVPRSLEDAALVDGCTRFGVFLRIALPLVRPGLAVTGFYNAIGAWNHFFFGLTLSTSNARTLPVYAAQLIGEYSIRWGEVSAIGTVLLLPPIVLVILMQRHLSGGLSLGGVKG